MQKATRKRKPGRSSGPRPEHRLAPLRQIECARCGEPFEARGKARLYCSRACARREERDRYRAKLRPMRCHYCEREFMGRDCGQTGNRYCSDTCFVQAAAWKRRTRMVSPLPWRDCPDCGIRFYGPKGRARCAECWQPGPEPWTTANWIAGYCADCGEAFVQRSRHPVRFCSRACGQAEKHRRRRASEKAAFVERVFRRKVFERDGYVCQICMKPTSPKWAEGDPFAPTVDHIHPINKGGDHSYANTQCAHARCNSRKQDSVDDHVQLRLAA